MIAQSESSETQEVRKGLAGLRVLLAEDSWHIGQAIKMVLESEGVAVLGPATTVPEARRLANSAPNDVAVIDVNLEGVMAFDFIDELGTSGLPIVVISGYDLPADLAAKVFATLQKPFAAEALLSTLRQLPIAQ